MFINDPANVAASLISQLCALDRPNPLAGKPAAAVTVARAMSTDETIEVSRSGMKEFIRSHGYRV